MANVGGEWQAEAVLAPPDSNGEVSFGISVALDGEYLLVGATEQRNGGVRTGAAYIYHFDGKNWNFQNRIVPDDGLNLDYFGYSVGLDGTRAFVGAPLNNELGTDSGAVYIYELIGPAWALIDKLTPSGAGQNQFFGISVAVSGDRVLVGASGDGRLGQNTGAAYSYISDGQDWQQEEKIIDANGEQDDLFGWSVALSGSKAVIGAPGDREIDGRIGSAQVFEFNGSGWSPEARLIADEGSSILQFGVSVAIRDQLLAVAWGGPGADRPTAQLYEFDGVGWVHLSELAEAFPRSNEFGASVAVGAARAIIGAPLDDREGFNSGLAFLFEESGGQWREEQQFSPPGGAGGSAMGSSLSIDEGLLLVGAPDAGGTIGSVGAGSAYLFRRLASDWVLEADILAADGMSGDDFGRSVSVWGNSLAIGAPAVHNGQQSNSGAVYIFEQSGSEWLMQARLQPSDSGSGDQFGSSVDHEAEWLLIGAPYDDDGGTRSGSVYVYRHDGVRWNEHEKLTAFDAAPETRFGASISIDNGSVVIGAYAGVNGILAGSAYVYRLENESWQSEAKLVPTDTGPDDRFGVSVSLSGDSALIGAPRNGAGGIDGAAYIFQRVGSEWNEVARLFSASSDGGNLFGTAVSIDSGLALVGAPLNNYPDVNAGTAHLYSSFGGSWTEVATVTASDWEIADRFGWSVAVEDSELFIGAIADDDRGPASGSTYVLDERIFIDGFEGQVR